MANFAKKKTARIRSIAGLPQDLTTEQRQTAVATINQIYDELAGKITDADSAADIAELFNQAKRDFERIVKTPEKVLATQGIPASKPVILLSALLALLGVICALLTLRHKHSKKTRMIASIAALAAVAVFFLTTGWNGIKLANIWTALIAVLTIIPAWLMLRKTH